MGIGRQDLRIVHRLGVNWHKVGNLEEHDQKYDPANCDDVHEHAVLLHVEPAGNKSLTAAEDVDADGNEVAEVKENKVGSL